MLKKILLLLAVFCTGCATTYYRDQTVQELDLKRYMGKWYVIAHIPTMFENGAYDAVETYSLSKHGEIFVDFRYFQDAHDGELETMDQVGWVYDDKTNAHWMIRPFWPLKFHYLVHYLNEDYSATMVGVPDHDYLWLMSRTPTLSDKDRSQMEEMAEALGYDLSELREIPHKISAE